MKQLFDADAFWKFPVVGILRGFTMEQVESAVTAAAAGGLRCVEVTICQRAPRGHDA